MMVVFNLCLRQDIRTATCVLSAEYHFLNQNEELIEMLNKLMKAGNADAFFQLGGHYADGNMGLPQDYAKANELYILRQGNLAVPRHFLT